MIQLVKIMLVSFNNSLSYDTLRILIFNQMNGSYLNFNNFIETPTSSSNGYIKNVLTPKIIKK